MSFPLSISTPCSVLLLLSWPFFTLVSLREARRPRIRRAFGSTRRSNATKTKHALKHLCADGRRTAKAGPFRPELDKFLSFSISSRKTQRCRPTDRLRSNSPRSLSPACPGLCGTPEHFPQESSRSYFYPSPSPLVCFLASPCFPVCSSPGLHRREPTTFDKRLGRLENSTPTSSRSETYSDPFSKSVQDLLT